MKKLILAVFFTPALAIASDNTVNQSESVEGKTYQPTKYCYYADKEYSIGARHLQADMWKTCVQGANDYLVWR